MPPKNLVHRSSLLSVRPMPQINENEASPSTSSEDLSSPPTIPPRSLRRHSLLSRSSPLSSPPSSPNGPPPYTFPNSPYLTPDSKEFTPASQQQRFRSRRGNPPPPWTNPSLIARRGGWYRLSILLLLLIALVIGLAVGLTIGLRNRAASSSSPAGADQDDDDTTVDFPLGSWSFATALTRTSSQCLPQAPSTPQAWQCYPSDTTYNMSTSGSAVTWNWVITSLSDKTYRISSSPNPFAPTFANATVQTLDASTPQERLAFSTTLETYTVLAPLPQQQGKTATCRYNRSVTLSGTLWTKEKADYPSRPEAVGTSEVKGDAKTFRAWPFRLEIQETVGRAVPECVDAEGRRVFVAEIASGGPGQCGCWYGNSGLGGGGTGRRWTG